MTINENIIEVRNVSKIFKVYHEKRNTVYETLAASLSRKKYYEELVVLDDISFTVKKGEMVGIIGLNGSGKSTLLKLIAGIYYPNKGKIITHGNLIPFLELGAGFQPELTAKENVILYGLILGFTKKEIRKKADEIIKFAELEKFSDTKIKNFSSGMYARLAFATAVQVDPDILLVDEILSVGDLPFQKKSFETFMQFKKKGKSIVFVSHGLDSVRDLCDRVIFIHKGRIHSMGEPSVVINAYRSIVDNISTIEQLRTRINSVPNLATIIDKDILELRPWYNDFSKLGINTGLEVLSTSGTKNQQFIEPIVTAYLERVFKHLREHNPTMLSMFCYDDAYYPIYCIKNFKCNKVKVIDFDHSEIERVRLISKKLDLNNIEIKLQDVHTLDENRKFDVVLNINGLHMVSDPENVLELMNKITKRFAIIQSVISLENEAENYFETPAPGWTWGCRFSAAKIKEWIEKLDWKIIASDRNILEFNSLPKEKGSVYFLCEKIGFSR